MTDIFISYASEDRDRVEPLVKALERQGWSLFWDRTIPAGKTWREVIGRALENAQVVLVVWSEIAVKSRWVQEESDRGLERNILIPVLIDDVRPPLGFGTIQAANLLGWEHTQSSPEFEKLISDISDTLGTSSIEVKGTASQGFEKTPKRNQEEEKKRKKADANRREVQKHNGEEKPRPEIGDNRAGEESKGKPVRASQSIRRSKADRKNRTAFYVSAFLLIVAISISALYFLKYDLSIKASRPSVDALKVDQIVEVIELKRTSPAQAIKEVDLSFKVPGQIVFLPIDVGEEVAKGQILAKIEDNESRSKINELQNKLAEVSLEGKKAQTNYERLKRLHQAKAVSKSDLDSSRNALEKYQNKLKALRSELKSTKNQLYDTQLRAPFSGLISKRLVENLQKVKRNQPIIAFQDISIIKLSIEIPENVIDYVRSSNNCRVHISAIPGYEFIATIQKVSATPSETTGNHAVSLLVEQIPGSKIIPGMTATVHLKMGVPGIKVPSAALFKPSENEKAQVWVIDQKSYILRAREVMMMEINDANILITDGLDPGELIVVNNVDLLKEGQRVKFNSINKK